MEAGTTLEEHGTCPELPSELWDQIWDCVPMSDLLRLSQVNHDFHQRLDKVEAANQAELTAALTTPNLTLIVVTGDNLRLDPEPVSGAYVVTTRDIAITAGRVHVRENVHVTATGNAWVHATGQARVTAADIAHVFAHGHTQVTAYGLASVRAQDQVRVTAHGDSVVEAHGNAQVTAHGQVDVSVLDQAHATAHHLATVWAQDDATVDAHDQTDVYASHRAQVTARDRANVYAHDQAQVTLRNQARLTAHEVADLHGDLGETPSACRAQGCSPPRHRRSPGSGSGSGTGTVGQAPGPRTPEGQSPRASDRPPQTLFKVARSIR
ncbi:F-box protein [Streptomyces erythrochromogenes]|uniref:F-box protein n=1 Tax=Streptomyces erythrochromogenes TaxID=285574 RepID=UPI003412B393